MYSKDRRRCPDGQWIGYDYKTAATKLLGSPTCRHSQDWGGELPTDAAAVPLITSRTT